MTKKQYQVIDEIADHYVFKKLVDGSAEVYMHVEPRFVNLLLHKLNEMYTNDKEIKKWSD